MRTSYCNDYRIQNQGKIKGLNHRWIINLDKRDFVTGTPLYCHQKFALRLILNWIV